MTTKLVPAIFYEYTDRDGNTHQDWAFDSPGGLREVELYGGELVGSGQKECACLDENTPEFDASYNDALLRFNRETGNGYWC